MADKTTKAKPEGFPIKPGSVYIVGKYEDGDDWMFNSADSETGYILIDLVHRVIQTSYTPQQNVNKSKEVNNGKSETSSKR